MSDAQDAAWRLRQRRHADQTRRRLTRIFDADGDGLSDSTLPMFGLRTAGRQGPPPSPISLPTGECVALEATGSIPDGGGYIEWDTILPALRSGFAALTAPVSQIACPFSGITQATVELVWTDVDHDSAWKGDGAAVRFDRNTEPLWPVFAPITGLPVDRLGTDSAKLPFLSGQQLGVFVHQESGESQPFTARLSWGMEDPQRLVVTDPVTTLEFFITYKGGTEPDGEIPDGTQEGDRLFVATFTRKVSNTAHSITSAGTWTQLAVGTSGSGRATLWTKLAAASEPTVTWNGSDTAGAAGIYVARVPGAVVVDAGAGAANAGSGALETEFGADAGPEALLLAWSWSSAGGAGAVSWVNPANSEVDYIHTGDPDSSARDAKAGIVALPEQAVWRARRESSGTFVALGATVVTLTKA